MSAPIHPAEFHSLAAPDREVIAALRPQLAPRKGTVPGPLMRASSNALMTQVPAAAGVSYEANTRSGGAGWWYRPAHQPATASAVLYLHGGAYVLGTAYHYRLFVGQMAARTGTDCFLADYRVSPEHPFPAAVEDAQAAYRGLMGLGRRRLAVASNSAGGGLALVTLALATKAAATAPTALAPHAGVAFSPWAAPALSRGQRRGAARRFRALRGAGARAAGVAAELHVWEGLGHVFPASVATLEAARQALAMVGAFLAGQLR